jgi:hypothetical protein
LALKLSCSVLHNTQVLVRVMKTNTYTALNLVSSVR